MKQLLIVDDEHHIVNWLADLFEGLHLDLSIYTAYNGEDALQLLRNIKIDIVLLDIRMPGMNGIEVSENILADWPGCHIIFLTGYNQFDYIYYANKHKQIDYLLKTECDEEIIRAVTNAIEAIDNEQKQREMSIQATSKEQLINHLFQRKYLRKLFMEGSLIESNAYTAIPDSLLRIDQPVLLLYGKIYSPAADSYYDQFYEMISRSIQVMEQVLYHKFHYAMLDYDESTIVWFLQPTAEFTERNSQSPLQYIKECFDDIISFYKRNSSCEIMLLLYHEEVAWKDVHNAFLLMNQSASLSSSGSRQSYGAIYQKSPTAHMTAQTTDVNFLSSCNAKLNEMSYCLSRGDIQQFAILLKQIELSCPKSASMHHLPTVEIYQRISSLLISYINKHQLLEYITPQLGLYPLYCTYDFETWQVAFAYLNQLTKNIFALSQDSLPDSAQKLVSSIKDYVHSHLSSNLTLAALSDVVNYNSAYVSRVFKQTSGINLSSYITTCRVNAAKGLLQTTQDSISSIAEKVRFDTPQYFSMVFQKQVGLSPSKFREVSNLDTSL